MRGRLGPQIIYLQYGVCVMLSTSMWLIKRGNLSPAAACKSCRGTTGQVWHPLGLQRFTPGHSQEPVWENLVVHNLQQGKTMPR